MGSVACCAIMRTFVNLIHIRYYMKLATPLLYRSDSALRVIGVVVDCGF